MNSNTMEEEDNRLELSDIEESSDDTENDDGMMRRELLKRIAGSMSNSANESDDKEEESLRSRKPTKPRTTSTSRRLQENVVGQKSKRNPNAMMAQIKRSRKATSLQQRNLLKRTYRNLKSLGRTKSAPVTYGDLLQSKKMALAPVTSAGNPSKRRLVIRRSDTTCSLLASNGHNYC